ncbi:unnamed protein product [Cuscuta epithymum]|uniref:Profilin n=1 Tax=Cuscuta epithymum TaxID=186058 RepID=A0AAV0FRW6_9ASTE|nr:unnamed protein product [Cuscuta epithymum]
MRGKRCGNYITSQGGELSMSSDEQIQSQLQGFGKMMPPRLGVGVFEADHTCATDRIGTAGAIALPQGSLLLPNHTTYLVVKKKTCQFFDLQKWRLFLHTHVYKINCPLF